jgi:hypothetical protein
MPLTASDVEAVLGPTDESLVAQIIATGATAADLAEAWAWINNDEALINEGRPLPTGKVAELCALLDEPENDLD